MSPNYQIDFIVFLKAAVSFAANIDHNVDEIFQTSHWLVWFIL